MNIELEKEELRLMIKCLIAFKVISMILRISCRDIKELLVKLNYYNGNENVFRG